MKPIKILHLNLQQRVYFLFAHKEANGGVHFYVQKTVRSKLVKRFPNTEIGLASVFSKQIIINEIHHKKRKS